MHAEEKDGNEILVRAAGKTILHYDIKAIHDLNGAMEIGKDIGISGL
jgi:hypothetical protein